MSAMQTAGVVDFGKRLVVQVIDDEVPELAAGLAYRFLFAIFPFGIFLTALAAFVAKWLGMNDPTGQILSAIGDNLPPDLAAQLQPQLSTVVGQTHPELLSIGAIGALWAATGGIGSLINAMNRAYDVTETRNFLVKTGLAVGLTLLLTAGVLVAFVTIVGGSVITEQVARTVGITGDAWTVISLARWPIMLALVALAVAVLFHFGPNVRVSFRWTVVGGVVFAIGWIVATGLFALYVANFGNYTNTYGALGGVVVLMLWFYLTALLLLIAAEAVALLATRREPERVEARRRETADTAAATDAAAGHKPTRRERRSREGREPRGAPPAAPAMPSTRPRPRRPAWPRASRSGNPAFAAAVVVGGLIVGAIVGLVSGRKAEDRA